MVKRPTRVEPFIRSVNWRSKSVSDARGTRRPTPSVPTDHPSANTTNRASNAIRARPRRRPVAMGTSTVLNLLYSSREVYDEAQTHRVDCLPHDDGAVGWGGRPAEPGSGLAAVARAES